MQDLALAGGHSTFGFVSEQLAAEQEARDKQRSSALVQHRSALLQQAAADRRHKAEDKLELFLIRQLEAEKMAGERRWLQQKKMDKRGELLQQGVPPHILERFFPSSTSDRAP